MVFKPVGRICVRRGKTCGIFVPLNIDLESGIYEIRKILGELTVVKIGQPAMPEARYEGLCLNELVSELPDSAMTVEEIQSAIGTKGERIGRKSGNYTGKDYVCVEN